MSWIYAYTIRPMYDIKQGELIAVRLKGHIVECRSLQGNGTINIGASIARDYLQSMRNKKGRPVKVLPSDCMMHGLA